MAALASVISLRPKVRSDDLDFRGCELIVFVNQKNLFVTCPVLLPITFQTQSNNKPLVNFLAVTFIERNSLILNCQLLTQSSLALTGKKIELSTFRKRSLSCLYITTLAISNPS